MIVAVIYIRNDPIYKSIRKYDSDIFDIARNRNFKPKTVRKIKEHIFIFIHKHYLDGNYAPNHLQQRQFDLQLRQALVWKRLEFEIHRQDDIIWMKHECAEQFVESPYNLIYSEANQIAQRPFNVVPWEKDY